MSFKGTLLFALISLLQSCLFPVSAQSANLDSAAFYFGLGKARQAAGDNNAAWIHLDKAAEFDPQNADIQLAIADVCMKLSRKENRAILALERASILLPADYAIQWRLVNFYFKYNNYQKVIELLPAVHAHREDTPDWAYMLGHCYNAIGDFPKAMQYLVISIKEEEPGSTEAAYMLARLHASMQNYTAAIPYYERALSANSPSRPARTYDFAVVLLAAGQYDAALKTFKLATDRGYKTNDAFLLNMANAYAGDDRRAEAIVIFKDMLRRRPQDQGLLNTLADTYSAIGKYIEARDCLDKILVMLVEGTPEYANVLYRIGKTYEKMGNMKDATQLYERAFLMDPSLRQLKKAEQKLFGR